MHSCKRQRNAFPSIPLNLTMAGAVAPLHRRTPCTFRSANHWIHTIMICFASFTLMAVHSEAFTISMDYQPPVKSSVSKMYDRRMSRTSTMESSASSTSNPNSRSSSRKEAFAGAYAPENVSLPSSTSSFERRMREMALGTQNKILRKKQTEEQHRPANVYIVESLEDYRRVVGEEKDRVVAVRFHASWCRACKAVTPYFYRLAALHKDIVFVDVPVTQDNAVIHQGLGVPSLPFGHIYHPQAGLVEELKLTRKDIQEFEDALIRTNKAVFSQ
ncbi:hypothetical protein MPSEU_000642200 [Mayamaea pseudoterrestris]|nr:hypothetical protein MPSEU_000642200 [Mayamaea pseudoterrestris]